ncbi:hypothetical protein G7068_11785 [Leucobacter viscericola]|uniref:Uncharacterized protein n=1 Tax=Leucobacter viscericola TaxID=2714935 RepID=A0A6G7XH64_9MICO|nr:hypothetical protein [Leucobacter viscericola]QIK63789.1 hypothetical protein G7068_11785 [Leucobacter viscericola]
MLEILLAAYLASLISGFQSPVVAAWEIPSPPVLTTIEALDSTLCESRAVGIADGLSTASRGEWRPLAHAGVKFNPKSLPAPGCQIAVTDDVRSVGPIDGIEKITGVGPTRFAVVWKVNR